MKEFWKKIEPYAVWVIFGAYIIFNGILLWNHEPWRDEANVWLMARNLGPLQLLREIKYQGHPCLWYFLVMPFAKMGFSFRTIGVLSTVIMAVAAWFYLWRVQQWLIIKALVLFSPIFTYFYPTIARNYCLIALLLILLAVNYSERNTHPLRYGVLLGLLVQADTIAIAPAGMITLVWLLENLFLFIFRKNKKCIMGCLKGAWIPLASLLFWIAQFYQVSDSPVFKVQRYSIWKLLVEIKNYVYIILIRMTGWSHMTCTIYFLLILIGMILISIKIRNIGSLAVFLFNLLFQCAFSVMVYQLHIWHYLSLCFTFIWMLWTVQEKAKEKQITKDKIYEISCRGVSVLVGILAVAMFMHWNSAEEPSNLQNALHGSYSDGENTAVFIKNNLESEDILISTNVCMESSVVAFLPEYHFYYAGTGKEETYADWSESQSRDVTVEDVIAWLQETFPEKEVAYLIQGNDSCIIDSDNLSIYDKIYETTGATARNEEYQIYGIRYMEYLK